MRSDDVFRLKKAESIQAPSRKPSWMRVLVIPPVCIFDDKIMEVDYYFFWSYLN